LKELETISIRSWNVWKQQNLVTTY
jgi:hypothetical protein